MSEPALSGVRVLDLTWVWSGPLATATLGDLGADVVKVEHRGRIDSARRRGHGVAVGQSSGERLETSLYFHQNNRNKRSLLLDLKQVEGKRLFKDLAAVSDIVVENFSPDVMQRLGLGYEELRRRKPDLIMCSMSAAGSGGPAGNLRGYAPVMSSLAGLESLVGYDSSELTGMIGFGISDPNAAMHAVVAILAALHCREGSGIGAHIELSQSEAVLATVPEAVAEAQVLGRPRWMGLAHPNFYPYGHFRCQGDDAWVALAVGSRDAWRALVSVLNRPELRDVPELDSVAGRRSYGKDLNRVVEEWTERMARDDVVSRMRKAGVDAVPVLSLKEMQEHPQFRTRKLFARLPHAATGDDLIARTPWSLAETPVLLRRSAPMLGGDSSSVLRDWLSLSDLEIRSYEEQGVLA